MTENIINENETTVPIDKIQPHPDNPRDGDVDRIAQSIEKNGFYGNVVVQKSTGNILAGNHRYKAAKQLGYNELPVTYVNVDNETALHILLADNKTSDEADYDIEQLDELLQSLDNSEPTAWFEDEIDRINDLSEMFGEGGSTNGSDTSIDRDIGQQDVEIRPVITPTDIATVENALSETGMDNRGEAFVEICQAYINGSKG